MMLPEFGAERELQAYHLSIDICAGARAQQQTSCTVFTLLLMLISGTYRRT